MEHQDGEMIKKCFELPLGTDLTTSSTNKSSPYFMAISMPSPRLSFDCETTFLSIKPSLVRMFDEEGSSLLGD